MRDRTQASLLLETLLPLLDEAEDADASPAELLALLRWAHSRCAEAEQAALGQRLVLAGVVPIPERPGADLLERLARDRFRGDPGARAGGGRIPLRYWALSGGAWPFAFGGDDLPLVGRLRAVDAVSFAAWLDDSVRRRGDADCLLGLVGRIRRRGTSAAAEQAIECVLALHAPGSPTEVEDRRFEALAALAEHAPEPLLSRLMHAVDPSELETRLAAREIEPVAALQLARAAMVLPRAFRQAAAAGLRAHLVAALDADFPATWDLSAAALLALGSPRVAAMRAAELFGGRGVTAADVERATGVALTAEEAREIAEALAGELPPRAAGARRAAPPGDRASDRLTTEAVLVRGTGGSLLPIELGELVAARGAAAPSLPAPWSAGAIFRLLGEHDRLVATGPRGTFAAAMQRAG